MKHPRLHKLIKSARTQSGFSDNAAEKQETRRRLIEATMTRRAQPPLAVFSFPGVEGFCVEAFRAVWPDTRIIGLDRQKTVIRFTKAHWHPRETVIGPIENELLHGALKDYLNRENTRLYRMSRSGQSSRLETFDFPKFDVMFLDTTMRHDNAVLMGQAARMIDEHCAEGAIVGVTLVLGPKADEVVEIQPILDRFAGLIIRQTTFINEPMVYFTGTLMLFFLLTCEASK